MPKEKQRVTVEGEAIVMIPVRVKYSCFIDATTRSEKRIIKSFKDYAAGFEPPKDADPDLPSVDEVIDVGGYTVEGDTVADLDQAAQDELQCGKFKVLTCKLVK